MTANLAVCGVLLLAPSPAVTSALAALDATRSRTADAGSLAPPPSAAPSAAAAQSPPPSGAPKRLPPLTVAGIAVMSTAAVGLGLLVTGLVQGSLAEDDYRRGPTRVARDQAESSGAKANTLAFVGALSAGVLLGVGTALVVLGQRVDQHDDSKHARVRPSAHGLEVRF